MRDFYREADRLRGRRRVWFVFVHALPALREQENLARYLDTVGVRRETLLVPGWLPSNRGRDGVSALLYDLSDPARLARASAETAAVQPPAGYSPGWCAHGPLSPPRRLPPQVLP